MEYTQSNISKISETYLLLRQSVTETRAQAERLYATYSNINREFELNNSKILELGAGSRGALIQLFNDTNTVVGIDKYLGALEQGVWKAAKTSVRKMLFDPLFYHHLKKLNDGKLNRKRDVLRMDAASLEFQENDFDFVYSRFFLEHVEAIDKIASETYRVLKPGGVTYHVFALYTSLDGAHTLDWKRFEPWQHLTTEVPSNAYVNKYRLDKYRDSFESVFGKGNVELRVKPSKDAGALLTPSLRHRLSDYSEDELLTSSPVIVAYKRSQH